MTIYVDDLMAHGWILSGRRVKNCHLFTDSLDLGELHVMATRIGMKLSWFQANASTPHYDLTASRREAAIAAGAVPLGKHQAVAIWKDRRARLQKALALTPQPQIRRTHHG